MSPVFEPAADPVDPVFSQSDPSQANQAVPEADPSDPQFVPQV